ncbi:helix-turn-helix domain-containing protein [Stenotrophomonas sp. NPDC087984]
MPEHTDIGSRLRDIRKRRGTTQRELAEASDVSVSLIRKLEQGELRDTRMETAHRLARALHVPTTHLLQRDEAPPSTPDDTDLWGPVQRAIQRPSVDHVDSAPTVTGVRQATEIVQTARRKNQFGTVASLLPALLRDADALDSTAPDARDTQAHALLVAGAALTQTHQMDVADVALSRALDTAENRHLSAAVTATRCWMLLRQGQLGGARELATRWADDMEPRLSRASVSDLAAWGWMLLKLAAAAARDNRPGEAKDALKLARGAAAVTERDVPSPGGMAVWGPTTVAYIRAEFHAVRDEPEKVLKIASQVPAPGRKDARRQFAAHNRHRLDVARAHVALRQHGKAVEILSDLRTTVPEWLAQQRYAQDIVTDVVERRRTLTPEMRTLADAVGLPL